MEIRSILKINMIREEFNNLDVNNQVDYFNEKLKDKDNNFNKLCKDIGVSKNTIINRFKNNGYVMCKDGQKITGFKEENKKAETKANDLYDINLILKRIDVLEQEIQKLKSENSKEVNNNFILDDFSGTTTTRTFKIDVRVNKELEQFLNKYSMYKKQDVISSLIKFAIDNIK